MIDLQRTHHSAGEHPARPRHRGLDGLVVGGGEVWLMVARDEEELCDLLWAGADDDEGFRGLRLCREVLPDGTVVLDQADPGRDPLLSELLGGFEREPE